MEKGEEECLLSSLSAFFSLCFHIVMAWSSLPVTLGFPPTQCFEGSWTSQHTKARSASMSR